MKNPFRKLFRPTLKQERESLHQSAQNWKVSEAAQVLSKAAKDKKRAKVRKTTDDLRETLGLPAVTWPGRA